MEMGDYLTKYKLESLDALLKKSESKKNYKPVDVFVDYINPIRPFKNMFKQSSGEFNVYLGKTAKAPLFFSLPECMFNDQLVNLVKNAIEKKIYFTIKLMHFFCTSKRFTQSHIMKISYAIHIFSFF